MKGVTGMRKDLEKLMEKTMDIMNEILLVHDNGRIIFANDTVNIISGYTKDEIIGHSIEDFIHPDDMAKVQEAVAKRRIGDNIFDYEIRVLTSQGDYRMMSIRSFSLDSKSTLVASMLADVTARFESEELLKSFYESIPDNVFILEVEDDFFRVVAANDAQCKSAGISKNNLLGKYMHDICREYNLPMGLLDKYKEVSQSKQTSEYEETIVWSEEDGLLYYNTRLFPVMGENGKCRFICGISRNITAKKLLEQELATRQEQLQMALEGAEMALWEWDITSDRLTLDEHWAKMLGMDCTSTTSILAWAEYVHPEDVDGFRGKMDMYLSGQLPRLEVKFRMRYRNVFWIWIIVRGRGVAWDQDGRTIRMIGTCQDISEQKMVEEELRVLATTDPLTGTYNRRYLLTALETEIDRCRRYGSIFSLIMCDMDNFKKINDTYGHDVGDRVLCLFTALIRSRIRKMDCLARWGGEEFILLVPHTRLPEAMELSQELRQLVRNNSFPDVKEDVTASFGVVEYRKNEDRDSLVKRVDDLVYAAKAAGRDTVCSDDLKGGDII